MQPNWFAVIFQLDACNEVDNLIAVYCAFLGYANNEPTNQQRTIIRMTGRVSDTTVNTVNTYARIVVMTDGFVSRSLSLLSLWCHVFATLGFQLGIWNPYNNIVGTYNIQQKGEGIGELFKSQYNSQCWFIMMSTSRYCREAWIEACSIKLLGSVELQPERSWASID